MDTTSNALLFPLCLFFLCFSFVLSFFLFSLSSFPLFLAVLLSSPSIYSVAYFFDS